jgi:hypothetical protein
VNADGSIFCCERVALWVNWAVLEAKRLGRTVRQLVERALRAMRGV